MFSHRARGTIQIKSMDTEKTRALCRCFTPRCLMARSEEHTSELQSRLHLVCRLLLEKKKKYRRRPQFAVLRFPFPFALCRQSAESLVDGHGLVLTTTRTPSDALPIRHVLPRSWTGLL